MADRKPASNGEVIAIGTIAAGAGLYFALVGLTLLPPPSRINGPIWLSLLAGIAFFSAGISVIVSGLTGAYDGSGEIPAGTPLWAKIVYWLNSVLAAASLAAIGTWVAFGSGTRHFSMSGFISGPVGEGIGRTAFGLGAILTWLIVLVFAREGAKKIFGKKD